MVLAPLCVRDEHRSLLAVVEFQVDFRRNAVVVESGGQRAAEIIVLQPRAGRLRQVRLEAARDGRKAILRDDVARKRVADEPGAGCVRARRPRVVDGYRQRGEIAVALRERGNRRQHRRCLPPVAVSVVGDEEEHPVPADRAAERTAVLVLVVFGLDAREVRLGVERLVAEELEPRSAEGVRSRLDDVVRRALPVEGHRGAAGLHLELVDRFDRDAERQVPALALDHGVGDRDALDVHVGGEVLTAHHVAPASDRLHARHDEHECRGVARAAGIHDEWKRGVHLVADRLAETCVLGGERRHFGRDQHFLRDGADLKHGIQADYAQRIDDDRVAGVRLEAAQRHRDAIDAGWQRHEREDARFCCLPYGLDAGCGVGGGDGRARHGRAGGVEHGALNGPTAADLRAGKTWSGKQQRRQHQQSANSGHGRLLWLWVVVSTLRPVAASFKKLARIRAIVRF